MTLQQALDKIDEMKPNTMSTALKIGYISQLEGRIHAEILMKHVHDDEDETCPTYDANTNTNTTELLVPDAYADVYVYFVKTKIDEQNQEEDKENNDQIRFANAWEDFSNYWTREHMPLQPAPYYIF